MVSTTSQYEGWQSATLLLSLFLTPVLSLSSVQELEALRGGEAARLRELSAEQRELRCELEAVHSEQARQLSQARQEQLELETRLEQLRQQACACEPGTQRQQEAHYTEQVKVAVVHVHMEQRGRHGVHLQFVSMTSQRSGSNPVLTNAEYSIRLLHTVELVEFFSFLFFKDLVLLSKWHNFACLSGAVFFNHCAVVH